MASSANDNDITLSVHPHLQQGDYQLSDCKLLLWLRRWLRL